MLIKAAHARNALQVGQRLAAHGFGAALGQHGACMPVNPRWLSAQVLRQRGNGLLHLCPLACAQRSARGPHQVVFVHLVKAALGVKAQSGGVALLGGAFADHAPDPAAFLGRELGAPAQFLYLYCGILRLQVGLANQRQRHKLAGLGAQRGELVAQVFAGVEVNGVDGFDPFFVQGAHGLGGHAQAVVFHAKARAHPGHLGLQLFGLDEFFGHVGASFIGLAQAQPQVLHLPRHIGAAGGPVVPQAVALDGAVVAHAVLGKLLPKSGPFAVAPELQQPVGAQAVFLVATGVAGQKALNLGLACRVQPGGQFPVRCPWLQGGAFGCRQQAGEAFLVTLLVGLGHVDHGLIVAWGI